MRKYTIVEIEKSYLNFFTPAAIVAIAYFLPSLIAWSLAISEWVFSQSESAEIDLLILNGITVNLSLVFVVIIIYFIFIPRLKVLDAEYREVRADGFFIMIPLFFFASFFRILIAELFKYFSITLSHESPWFETNFKKLDDPVLLLLFFLHSLVISNLFSELMFRRTLIPLLEDRGLSPFHAVILSSIGFSFLNLPYILLYPENPTFYFLLITYICYSLCVGITYILTRNILFPILFHAFYFFHYYTGSLGSALDNENLLLIHDSLNVLTVVLTIIIIPYVFTKAKDPESSSEWMKVIKKHSVPYIQRGVIGFFVISIGFLAIQALVEKIGNELTDKIFPEYFVFIIGVYLVAFSIPFWLTISTEYARD